LVAKQLGNDVTGSDADAYPPTPDILTQAGIKWVDGHAAGNVMRWGKPDLVVQGNQVRDGNPETEAARKHQIRLVSEAEYWGELTADRFRIVVAGSAGKTTTASLIAWILRVAGRNPGFRLGLTARDLGSAAAWGSGREPTWRPMACAAGPTGTGATSRSTVTGCASPPGTREKSSPWSPPSCPASTMRRIRWRRSPPPSAWACRFPLQSRRSGGSRASAGASSSAARSAA